MPEPGSTEGNTRGPQKPIKGITIEGFKPKTTRRNFIIGTAATVGLAAFKKFGASPRHAESHTIPQTPEKEKLENELLFAERERIGGPLDYSKNSNVAQYYDAHFEGNPSLNDGLIRVHNEPRGDADTTEDITNREMSQLTLGAIRTLSTHTNESANSGDYFTDNMGNVMYEWLVPGRFTADQEKPFQFVDAHGKDSDEPWFISPIVASLDLNTMQYISMPKTEPVE
ncbi:MAG: hypothetical protein HZC02_01150 [Candidatus Levybacteria bacterium]|nr:hypothetical protein [Candidatus Levybacteria bacterium]